MFENVDFATIVTWVMTVAIPTAVAIFGCIKAKDWKGAFAVFRDAMTPNVPQTEEQTALVQSDLVGKAVWQMTDTSMVAMFKALQMKDVKIPLKNLKSVVATMEERGCLEYGIRFIRDGESIRDDNTACVFVTYGTPVLVDKWSELKEILVEHACSNDVISVSV